MIYEANPHNPEAMELEGAGKVRPVVTLSQDAIVSQTGEISMPE